MQRENVNMEVQKEVKSAVIRISDELLIEDIEKENEILSKITPSIR